MIELPPVIRRYGHESVLKPAPGQLSYAHLRRVLDKVMVPHCGEVVCGVVREHKVRLDFGHAGSWTLHRLMHGLGRRDWRRDHNLLFLLRCSG